MKKSGILLVGGVVFLALMMPCYKDQSEFLTLPVQSSAEIIVAGQNQTIGILLDGLERRAMATNGMAKPRQAAPPMPRSYPIKSPPKPKPTKK